MLANEAQHRLSDQQSNVDIDTNVSHDRSVGDPNQTLVMTAKGNTQSFRTQSQLNG